MRVELWRKYVDRIYCPSNRSLDGTIKEISKEFVIGYNTNCRPMLNEKIRIGTDEGTDIWKVVNIIHQFEKDENGIVEDSEYLICEVRKVTGQRIAEHGSDTWEEIIPEVCDVTKIVG